MNLAKYILTIIKLEVILTIKKLLSRKIKVIYEKGEQTSTPQWMKWKMKELMECGKPESLSNTRTVVLQKYHYEYAAKVHREIIKEIKYVKDEAEDNWKTSCQTWSDKFGDCEDQAILIWRKLIKYGFPQERTYIVIIEGHAFAAFEPDNNDKDFYILDNGSISLIMTLASEILPYLHKTPLYGFNYNSFWTINTTEIK
uniref:Putative peptidase n=1 Tax=viral metagenome TaxID=1070528 RepID=A0A6M3KBA5_9ZZZZ